MRNKKPTGKQCAVNAIQLRLGSATKWENMTYTQLELMRAALDKAEAYDRFKQVIIDIVEGRI